MARPRLIHVCDQCGHETVKWEGRCPDCGAWNSMVETMRDVVPSLGAGRRASGGASGRVSMDGRARAVIGNEPVSLLDVTTEDAPRIDTGIGEFDRVLGGGIVPGGLALIGGDPGIGKSTLLLQVAARVALPSRVVLYVSGEESARQVRMRATRLDALVPSLYVLAETNVEAIIGAIERLSPSLVIIDSIQTTWSDTIPSSPGNVAQLREVTLQLMQVSKSRDVPIFLIGHVTKEGNVAGPRALEHMVDAVIYLEGERLHSYRLLRAIKNRFGSTNEIGVFEMGSEGLTEVANPSLAFLAGRVVRQPGSVVTAPLEGTRSLLLDIQALTVPAGIGIARRTVIGADVQRLQLLVAVLTRRIGLPVASHDVYINVAGGMKVTEPGVDLAVAVAIVSSYQDRPVDERTVVVGEVGLQGEIRPAAQIERRLAEAERLGFNRCILAERDLERLVGPAPARRGMVGAPVREGDWRGMRLIGVAHLAGALVAALGPDALAKPSASKAHHDRARSEVFDSRELDAGGDGDG